MNPGIREICSKPYKICKLIFSKVNPREACVENLYTGYFNFMLQNRGPEISFLTGSQ